MSGGNAFFSELSNKTNGFENTEVFGNGNTNEVGDVGVAEEFSNFFDRDLFVFFVVVVICCFW